MPSKNGCSPPHKPSTDLILRGVKGPSPAGTTAFVGLRALDPLLQYHILAHGLGTGFLARLGLSTVPLSAAVVTRTGLRLIDRLGLPLDRLLLLGMAAGAAAKHILWVAYLSQEAFPVRNALPIAAYNTLCNGLNSLLLLAAATSASLSTWPWTVPVPGAPSSSSSSSSPRARLSLPVALGALLFVVGTALETASEVQRKRFKDNPDNKGKLCREGLWAWARHVNYGGYWLWRSGYALASGGWVAGAAMALLQGWFFAKSGMVSLDYYMSRRYKDQWGRYKEDVRWKLFPGIY